MTWLRAHISVPLAVLVVGFTFSLVANVAWSWEGGPIRVLGGALASMALPGAIHLWHRIPTAGTWQVRGRDVPVMRIVRAVVMTLIAALAAVTTFAHASALLIAHGEHPLLAMAYPVITELVVVMAALALEPGRRAVTATPARRPTHRADPVVKPEPTAPVRSVGSSMSERARQFVRDEFAAGRRPEGADVDAHLRLEGKARCGARAVRQVLEERERVS